MATAGPSGRAGPYRGELRFEAGLQRAIARLVDQPLRVIRGGDVGGELRGDGGERMIAEVDARCLTKRATRAFVDATRSSVSAEAPGAREISANDRTESRRSTSMNTPSTRHTKGGGRDDTCATWGSDDASRTATD
jgi:hypothetical protein